MLVYRQMLLGAETDVVKDGAGCKERKRLLSVEKDAAGCIETV